MMRTIRIDGSAIQTGLTGRYIVLAKAYANYTAVFGSDSIRSARARGEKIDRAGLRFSTIIDTRTGKTVS